jgi:hypothetical protein
MSKGCFLTSSPHHPKLSNNITKSGEVLGEINFTDVRGDGLAALTTTTLHFPSSNQEDDTSACAENGIINPLDE